MGSAVNSSRVPEQSPAAKPFLLFWLLKTRPVTTDSAILHVYNYDTYYQCSVSISTCTFIAGWGGGYVALADRLETMVESSFLDPPLGESNDRRTTNCDARCLYIARPLWGGPSPWSTWSRCHHPRPPRCDNVRHTPRTTAYLCQGTTDATPTP